LTLEEWKKVIDDLIENKVFFVNLSGGEITQCPHFKEIINYLSKRGLHFILTTNGVFSNNLRDFIVSHQEYLIGIKISLDGPDAKSHCALRLDSNQKFNPEIFKATLKNIYFFRDHNIPLTIATVLHKDNIKKLEKFRELIKKINPVSWFISPIIPIGRGDTNKFISEFYEYYNTHFWSDIQTEGKEKGINVRLIDVPLELRKDIGTYSCPAALNTCEIHSDGTVSPCTLCRICIPKEFMEFENIMERNLKKIWEGKVFEKFRSYMDKGCEGCNLLSRCNKCIPQSFRYFKNGEAPAPFCIKNGKKLGLKNLERYEKLLKEEIGEIK
jgi:radical SAM protein with 4Fe4S-binding SPASM domain